jgi:NADH:quinone reductase (non-electrogenic)
VELAGTLAELGATVLAATFPDVDPARVHVRLIEMAPSLLTAFQEKLREYARVQLDKRGVDIRLNTRIAEITDTQVLLADAENLPSNLTVWAAGVGASEAVAGWGLPQGQGGRILVGPDLRVRGQDRIFAVGDIAVNPDNPTPSWPSPRCRWGGTRARRSSSSTERPPPSRSPTTTRA